MPPPTIPKKPIQLALEPPLPSSLTGGDYEPDDDDDEEEDFNMDTFSEPSSITDSIDRDRELITESDRGEGGVKGGPNIFMTQVKNLKYIYIYM